MKNESLYRMRLTSILRRSSHLARNLAAIEEKLALGRTLAERKAARLAAIRTHYEQQKYMPSGKYIQLRTQLFKSVNKHLFRCLREPADGTDSDTLQFPAGGGSVVQQVYR